jgi:cell division protein FtsA
MEEIIEHVHYEIKSSGFEKKLIAGIVITGGGAQLRHLVQLVEFITGMDTRIGYPNEHLAKGSDELKSPMYSTGVGLVIKGFLDIEKRSKEKLKAEETELKKKMGEKVTQPQEVSENTFFSFIRHFFEEEKDKRID